MEIEKCVAMLRAQGSIVERDERAGREDHWLVFDPPSPEEMENGGWPNFFSTSELIQWVERHL